MNVFAQTENFIARDWREAALQSSDRFHAIKTEPSPSPRRLSSPFQFTFRSPVHSRSRSSPELPVARVQPLQTFRPSDPFPMSWHIQSPNENTSNTGTLHDSGSFDIASLHQSMPFAEEYDDLSGLVEQPSGMTTFQSLPGSPGSFEKTIRRRSSKACDQCRKSKCKCERSAPGEPCKSCVILGTPCTFLGPSRKRGPPKGYIDAIEARLHQTEALLGIMLASRDERAQSLLRDIAQDPLASAIINRVNHSPYGSQGHKRAESTGTSKLKTSQTASDVRLKVEADQPDFHSTHPSHEWQAQVVAMLDSVNSRHIWEVGPQYPSLDPSDSQNVSQQLPSLTVNQPRLQVVTPNMTSSSENLISPTRRQRRRIGTDDLTFLPTGNVYARQSSPPARLGRGLSVKMPLNNSVRSLSPLSEYHWASATGHEDAESRRRRDSSPLDSFSTDSEEDLTGAAGQLSLNEDEQVRYHGKASGLHLLGDKDRNDLRNEGGIWRFPKAGVWPPLPSDTSHGAGTMTTDDEFLSQLPDPVIQEQLVDLYFTHVHPSFPVVHKRAFFDVFKTSYKEGHSSGSPPSDPLSKCAVSPFNRRRRRIPTLLLLAMYAIAARYSTGSDVPTPPPDGTILWAAGDEYLNKAKVILNGSYASSRSSTCQALLLMGYREIGMGAMAQAWIYIGMAIRMAQDLGLHRSADGWARAGLGGRLFNEWELHERKRIWYGCVIMDKYVSTYIGRPLSIFEWDFDTTLPTEDEPEEFELWTPVPSKSEGIGWDSKDRKSVPGRIISCFNASATLSGLLSLVVQSIYAVRPIASRHSEALHLESLLDKWYIELPVHLRHEPGPSKLPVPAPHILTLHMQYWCTVLLLHRPFIRHSGSTKCKGGSEHSDDGDARILSGKSYEMCTGAANHITSIVSVYIENFNIEHCTVFLCYYIFTASIMHVMTLTTYPRDPQAQLGLTKCMDALRRMQIVWPSAGRALDLLTGSKISTAKPELSGLSNHPDRHKRLGEQHLDVEDAVQRGHFTTESSGYLTSRPQQGNPAQYVDVQDIYTSNGDVQSGVIPVDDVSFPSYERWPSESTIAQPFSGTISTSVLPQLYSTGLVDGHASGVRLAPHHRCHEENDRYPQYWNDYSTFPQLGTAYGDMPTLLDHQPYPHPAQPSAHYPSTYALGYQQ